MATLTKSTGTVALSGAAEKVTLPASYGWVWVKNMSEGDIFAGLSENISEGADGVMVIPSGECGRIQADGFNSVYLLGTGNALVIAQNYADCPFKAGAKGGELPVASTDTLGGVMVDGTSITADEQGVISAVGGGGLTLIGTYNLSNFAELGSLDDLPRGTKLLFECIPTFENSTLSDSTCRLILGCVPDEDGNDWRFLVSPVTSNTNPNYMILRTSNGKLYANISYLIENWNVYKWGV